MRTVIVTKSLALWSLIALLTICTGCAGGSRSASVASWQKNVEQYVSVHGKGDPAVLRDLTLSDSRRGYAMVGSDDPAQSSDANGLLLGVREIDGRTWFIYLVGVVERQKVSDIKLAGLTTDGGRMEWKLGPSDKQSLDAYRAYNDKRWRERFPGRAAPPPQYSGFPTPDDLFQMRIDGSQINVTHPHSGARWSLTITPGQRRA